MHATLYPRVILVTSTSKHTAKQFGKIKLQRTGQEGEQEEKRQKERVKAVFRREEARATTSNHRRAARPSRLYDVPDRYHIFFFCASPTRQTTNTNTDGDTQQYENKTHFLTSSPRLQPPPPHSAHDDSLRRKRRGKKSGKRPSIHPSIIR